MNLLRAAVGLEKTQWHSLTHSLTRLSAVEGGARAAGRAVLYTHHQTQEEEGKERQEEKEEAGKTQAGQECDGGRGTRPAAENAKTLQDTKEQEQQQSSELHSGQEELQ